MLVKRTDGSEKMEPIISLNNGVATGDGITSIQLGLHDLNKLIDLSPTQLMAVLVRIKRNCYSPLLGKL